MFVHFLLDALVPLSLSVAVCLVYRHSILVERAALQALKCICARMIALQQRLDALEQKDRT